MKTLKGNKNKFLSKKVKTMKSSALHLLTLLLASWIGGGNLTDSAVADKTDAAFSVAALLRHKQAFDRPHDVELQGDLAFVPGKGGSLAIVNISNPTEPRVLWHRHDPKRLKEAETVLPANGFLFLGTHDFLGIDIRDTRKPVFETKLSTTPKISHINGMARRADMVFAAGKNGVLAAFDCSRTAAPTVVAALDIRREYDVGHPHDVDLYTDYAVVPDPRGFDRAKQAGKLAVVQVFDAKSGKLLPVQQWRLTGMVTSDELAGANRVQVFKHRAFVGASTRDQGGRLVVVNLSQANAPQQVASLPFAPHDGWGPNGLALAGQVVFLAGGQSIEAVDVSCPEKPVKLASQRFAAVLQNACPRYPGGGDSGHDLVYRDGYLYVTGQNDHCLLVLRVESKRLRSLAEGGE